MTYENLITQVAIAMIGLLAFAILFLVIMLAPKVKRWIDDKAAAGQNEIVWYWAQQAYAYAERKGRELGSVTGSDKAKLAYEWLRDRLKAVGVNVTSDQIKEVIELAWHKLEQMPKAQGSTAVINTEIAPSDEHFDASVERSISRVLDTTK